MPFRRRNFSMRLALAFDYAVAFDIFIYEFPRMTSDALTYESMMLYARASRSPRPKGF